MPVTIRRILEFAVVREVNPQVLGREDLLGTEVRDIHVAESPEVAGLIEGGELILCSGLSLHADVGEVRAFVERFADAGACGVIFSFLSESDPLKPMLAEAAESAAIPVILLDDRARFIAITDAVQHLLRAGSSVREARAAMMGFLSSPLVGRLSAEALFDAVADMLSGPVAVVSALGEVVALRGFDTVEGQVIGEGGLAADLGDWARHPFSLRGAELGAIVSPLALNEPQLEIIFDRFAEVLADRLPDGAADLDRMRSAAASAVLTELRGDDAAIQAAAEVRAEIMGIGSGRRFVPVAVHLPGRTAEARRLIQDAVETTMLGEGIRVVGVGLGDDALGFVLVLDDTVDDDEALGRLHAAVSPVAPNGSGSRCRTGSRWSMGVGSAGTELAGVARVGLDEAARAAVSASSLSVPRRDFYRPADLGVHWLAQGLVDSPDAGVFVRDQLGPLLEDDDYLRFVEDYLACNGSVAELARAIHLSRPRVYARLRRLEGEWGFHLDDADVRTSVHLAILLHRLGVTG